MKTIKTIGDISLLALAVFSALIIAAYVMYRLFDTTITTGTNYIDEQVGLDVIEAGEDNEDEYAERWFMEVNYYSNDNNNGFELSELTFNYFTDYTLNSSAYYSIGMQFVGENPEELRNYFRSESDYVSWFNGKLNPSTRFDDFFDNRFYYYNGSFDIWTSAITYPTRNLSMIVKIGGEPFLIQLNKYYTSKSASAWYILSDKYRIYFPVYTTLFGDVINAVKNNSQGAGDWYMKMDLSDYFSVKKYDASSGKWSEQEADEIWTYAVVKFHYSSDGAVNSTQSMFNMINGERTGGSEVNTDYWQAHVVYELAAAQFVYRYSEAYGGWFVALSTQDIKNFAALSKTEFNVTVDISKIYSAYGYNVVGIDYDGFAGLDIDTLSIISTSYKNQTFYISEGAVTSLNTLAYSSSLTLNISDGALPSDYTEVILS